MSDRARATAAAIAAIFASLGDLAMLWVGNARRTELALPAPPEGTLLMGALLGVVCIPIYAIGYAVAARAPVVASARARRAIVWSGTVLAIGGAIVHGLTALEIRALLANDAPALSPAEAIASAGPLLLGLWTIVLIAGVVASAIFARSARASSEPGMRLAALASPALSIIALVAVALTTSSPLGEAFLAPAAPNLAHVLFFALLARSKLR